MMTAYKYNKTTMRPVAASTNNGRCPRAANDEKTGSPNTDSDEDATADENDGGAVDRATTD